MTTEEKLKHFEEASLESAKVQGANMISEYEAVLAQLEQEHMAMKKRQADLQIKTETDRFMREKNITLSKEQLEIKRLITKKQNELKDKLFSEVLGKLEEFMDTPAYEKLLITQIKNISAMAAKEKVAIYIDPSDASRLPSLSAATNKTLTLSEYSFMGGTRAVLDARHILIDNSFATKLSESKAKFTFTGGNLHE